MLSLLINPYHIDMSEFLKKYFYRISDPQYFQPVADVTFVGLGGEESSHLQGEGGGVAWSCEDHDLNVITTCS